MILSTTETVAGQPTKKTLGIVRGHTIRAKHFGKDILASLKNVVGGELRGYTKLIGEARDEAVLRMEEEAKKLGADAIVSVRFATSQVAPGAAEVLAYGTAVKIAKTAQSRSSRK